MHSTVGSVRQMTPSMHVVFLQKTLYGADVNAVNEAGDTADFQVALTPYLRSELTVEYSSANGRHVIAGNLPLMTEAIRFGVFSRDPQIDLVSKSPLPVKFQSADFECNYELPGGYAVYRG
jgi:hypothetical protein